MGLSQEREGAVGQGPGSCGGLLGRGGLWLDHPPQKLCQAHQIDLQVQASACLCVLGLGWVTWR